MNVYLDSNFEKLSRQITARMHVSRETFATSGEATFGIPCEVHMNCSAYVYWAYVYWAYA